jgi:hypothetical protein
MFKPITTNAPSGATALLQFLINKLPQKQLLVKQYTSENSSNTSYTKLGKNISMKFHGSRQAECLGNVVK